LIKAVCPGGGRENCLKGALLGIELGSRDPWEGESMQIWLNSSRKHEGQTERGVHVRE